MLYQTSSLLKAYRKLTGTVGSNPNTVFDDPRIEIIADQEFYQENDLKLKLDIYRPRGSKKNLPAILQIHGGGWISGSKRQAALLMSHMAAQGWVCFSVVHRFSPEIVFPEHLIDIKRALHWIKKNAGEYGVDPEFCCGNRRFGGWSFGFINGSNTKPS